MHSAESASPLFAPVAVVVERPDDKTIVLRNCLTVPTDGPTIPQVLCSWAESRSDRVFLTEPVPAGGRRAVTYAQAAAVMRAWSARLLSLGLDGDQPLAIIGANGINHALLMLAAGNVGIPAAIISAAYVLGGASTAEKLRLAVVAASPAVIFADMPAEVSMALAAIGQGGIPVRPLLVSDPLAEVTPVPDERLAALEAAVGPETVAKLLFTSGSSGSPKPVPNTQRMMISNMQGLEQVWRFLGDRPPVLVDWLPWNHTFGGNCCFNLVLYFGGTLHIDQGKPVAKLIGQTVAALRDLQPTVYFNVPAGFEALLPVLETDLDFAARFFGNLDFLFNAGAALPASTRARLLGASTTAIGRCPPIIGGWGSTETAPFSTVLYFATEHAQNLGVPLPGVAIKMVSVGGRTELRVRGPNVMPGYWRQPVATADAFDAEGFYCIGDAGRLADPACPEKGILFDGRVAENFKLASGTWVNVSAIRLAAIAAAKPLIADAVVTGEGRDAVGLLIFANEAACKALLGEAELAAWGDRPAARHPIIAAAIRSALQATNAGQTGSSLTIRRFDLLDEAASLRDGEVTEKGYLNQRAILSRRADRVEALYHAGHLVAGGPQCIDGVTVGAGIDPARLADAGVPLRDTRTAAG